jgi:hypothetical protein
VLSLIRRVSYCRVDADGIPAEWVEAGVATEAQPTYVWFVDGGVETLERCRGPAGDLASATGARVLTVACSWGPEGLVVLAWLFGEGCDVDRTTIVFEPSVASLL